MKPKLINLQLKQSSKVSVVGTGEHADAPARRPTDARDKVGRRSLNFNAMPPLIVVKMIFAQRPRAAPSTASF
ncbi:hypothetical protein EVAR_85414_1 [Eumeta japonica]|uniref:Uncharacterized protein n=1 Tax=Eumeta variegata TaxID=151549 RepID=A0A4C1WJK7_EUMVA|nr:hypothetical protein EVAR_85414_1 [Eumeta japonica]